MKFLVGYNGSKAAQSALALAKDFAKVFIATGWLTINWDLYQYEWTLLFMSSSNGGQTITYDYFLL